MIPTKVHLVGSIALDSVEEVFQTALLYEATIEDPKVFTQPWKIRKPLRLQKGIQILEDECEGENGRRHHVPLLNKTGRSAR